ncbi:MAG: hypothetical protein WCO18_00445, partial [bacterium]
TGWTSLPNCSVDTNAHTVTCTTDHFSAISLFGLHLSLPTNQRSVGHSGSILPAFAATSTGISSSLNGEVKTPADVAALKAELNTKIVSVIKQLIDLLTQRLNSLLGI